MRRHLFGPVSATFADQNLRRPMDAGACVAFNHDGPFAVGPFETWESVAARFPADWRPDFLVLHLQYNTIPAVLWQAPIPIVGLAGDYNLLWHHYRHVLPMCDLVLADAPGVERLARDGITHARAAQLYGCERGFVEFDCGDGPRDIDILFVGNVNPAVQGERLPWLGRLAKLKKRWNVHITSNVFGDDYRKLLGRAKIVFNRSIRGEWNNRTSEAIAAGALLFQEAENQEVARLLQAGNAYVAYADANLEELLVRYLEDDGERRRIAANAHRRRHELTFEAFWAQTLATIEDAWPQLQERAARRRECRATLGLTARTWQQVSSSYGEDHVLVADLNEALAAQPRSAELNHALGVTLWQRAPRDADRIASAFQTAWQSDPRHVTAGLNLAEVLALLGQKAQAIEQARRTLAMLDRLAELPPEALNAPHVPTDYDVFRVEWERAAWQHAGDCVAEEKAKRRLLRRRLHELLSLLTDDLVHTFCMAAELPDLPTSLARLGNALGHRQRPAEALQYLQRAAALNPFDRQASRALQFTLTCLGRTTEMLQFCAEQRLLAAAAPSLAPIEPWFAEIPIPATQPKALSPQTFRIAWHGAQAQLHSLSLVNREICERLVQRGHELSLNEPPQHEPASRRAPLVESLRARLDAPLSEPADVHITHQWPPDFAPPAEGHWVIIQPWEWGSLPRAWLAPMAQQLDEVWVPSNFVRNTFLGSGVPADQVQVIPNGVADIYFAKHPPLPLQTKKRFKFLFVGGTIPRKGIDLLLTAYEQCFSAKDDICLVIKDMGVGSFYRGQTAEEQIQAIRAKPHAPEIEYFADELSPEEMAGLYTACDCLVHPYRGEGFGLPIAEALAAGLPVIVTGFGAALDFCREGSAYLISARAQTLDRGRGELETVQPQYWAQPDLDHLRCLMRHVWEHPDEARAKARLGREFLRQHFTWEHTVAAVEERIQQLRTRPIRRLQRTSLGLQTPSVGNGKPTVSLTMIVRNEEKNLADCLRPIADLFDEIIVVDTGSTERTKEIALQAGAKVFDFPWVDSFAAARNESLRHATGQWIFWMDADDRIDEDNCRKLRELFARLPHGQMVCYDMKVACVPQEEGDSPMVVDHVRLFPNHPSIRWQYRVHEQILGAVRSQGGTVEFTDIVIRHVGYCDKVVHKRKGERNLRLLQMDNEVHPDDPYILFNLGSALQEFGRLDESIQMCRRSLELSHPSDSIVRKLYADICQSQRLLGDNQAALKTCQDGRAYYPHDVDLLWEEAHVRHSLGDLQGALGCIDLLLQGREGEDYFASVDQGKKGFKARFKMGCWLKEAGQLREAEEQWRQARHEAPAHIPTLEQLAQLGWEQDRLDLAEEMIGRVKHAAKGELDAETLRARMHLAKKEFATARSILKPIIQRFPEMVYPLVVLSHVFLQEGSDLTAAEQTLRSILALDPNHPEAKQNLHVLMMEQTGKKMV